ncbi:hypothetical protein DRH14_02820 [Candidatus Shapirobacteria bacterium]|nr:MAG: hypothetical protein DRH14_02820 [Candidatus Shapirobacteria bacterium]
MKRIVLLGLVAMSMFLLGTTYKVKIGQFEVLGEDCPLITKGDINCNGKIDISDFAIWKMNFINYKNISPTPVGLKSCQTQADCPIGPGGVYGGCSSGYMCVESVCKKIIKPNGTACSVNSQPEDGMNGVCKNGKCIEIAVEPSQSPPMSECESKDDCPPLSYDRGQCHHRPKCEKGVCIYRKRDDGTPCKSSNGDAECEDGICTL